MSHSRGPQSSPLARESHVLLEEHWAQPHHHWLLAERSTNWKKTALKYPLLNPTPHPGPWVCSHHGNFWKHQSYFPGGGEGWKQGIKIFFLLNITAINSPVMMGKSYILGLLTYCISALLSNLLWEQGLHIRGIQEG